MSSRAHLGQVVLLLGAAVSATFAADKPKSAADKTKTSAPAAAAEPAADQPFELTEKWTTLVVPVANAVGRRALPAKGLLKNCPDLTFTGPRPGHPFVIGDFAVDGEFGVVNGGLERTSGRNAAIELPRADQFELEGIMDQIEFGGWFLLSGWEDGRGYLLSNVTMRESGSPWFISELRGGVAIADGTQQLMKAEWLRSQPFRLTVAKRTLTLEVGKTTAIKELPLENYAPGRVILGVYDTQYGPKRIHVQSLRMRALRPAADVADE